LCFFLGIPDPGATEREETLNWFRTCKIDNRATQDHPDLRGYIRCNCHLPKKNVPLDHRLEPHQKSDLLKYCNAGKAVVLSHPLKKQETIMDLEHNHLNWEISIAPENSDVAHNLLSD